MIEARGLTKRYGEKTAVDGVDLTVRPGVVTGFLGPNGAGKSTTMRMIIGLDAPTAGSVTVNGLDPEGVLWIRRMLTDLAAAGRTVFVSSHLMSEMALVADHLIIVGRGRVLADTTVQSLVRQAGGDTVVVASAVLVLRRISGRWCEVVDGDGTAAGRVGTDHDRDEQVQPMDTVEKRRPTPGRVWSERCAAGSAR